MSDMIPVPRGVIACIKGWWRLRFGFCPVCNSSPPITNCPVCRGSRDYGSIALPGRAAAWRSHWYELRGYTS